MDHNENTFSTNSIRDWEHNEIGLWPNYSHEKSRYYNFAGHVVYTIDSPGEKSPGEDCDVKSTIIICSLSKYHQCH